MLNNLRIFLFSWGFGSFTFRPPGRSRSFGVLLAGNLLRLASGSSALASCSGSMFAECGGLEK
jgi:hypothetical protein